MTEQQQTASNENAGPADNSAATSVKKGTGLIALVILLSLTWYLVADRVTPYTSQARVQGYVIGVAAPVPDRSVAVRNRFGQGAGGPGQCSQPGSGG